MGSKYYAVRVGRSTGVYDNWSDCKNQVDGYSGNQYKSFSSLREAQDYVQSGHGRQVDGYSGSGAQDVVQTGPGSQVKGEGQTRSEDLSREAKDLSSRFKEFDIAHVPRVCYPSWDDPGPLNLQSRHDIPKNALKTLTKYNGTEGMAREHLEDVAALAILHGITHEDVMIRLLVLSLEGRPMQWYKLLGRKSICLWDDLAGALVNTFDGYQDPLQLLMHLSTIMRASLESITDFNIRFWRSWQRISEEAKPTPAQAHVFYVRAFHPDIGFLLLQSGEQRFPQIFQEAVQAERFLLLSGKMQWRETAFPSLSPPRSPPP